jgi:uncharacterized Zn finger protein
MGNQRQDDKDFGLDSVATCPKCQSELTRHLVWSQEGQRVYTYHCAKDGDVVPVIAQ